MYMPEGRYAGETARDANAAVRIVQILSHVTLALVVYVNYARRHWFTASWAAAGLVSSIMYHVCRADIYCFGCLRDELRKNDHAVQLTLAGAYALELLFLDCGRETGVAWRVWLPFVATLAVRAYPYQLQSVVLVVLYLAVVAADRFFRLGALRLPAAGAYRPRWIGAGAGILLLALGLYFWPSDARHGDAVADGLVHALWHVLVGFALMALTLGVPRVPAPSASLDISLSNRGL